MLEKLKGFKTILFNVLVAVIGILTFINPDSVLPSTEEISTQLGQFTGSLLFFIGLFNGLLRAVTTTSIFSKG